MSAPVVRTQELVADLTDARAKADRLSGDVHRLRGELDGARRSLERAHRLLGVATERCDALKASRDRAYAVVDAHADRLDVFASAAADGNLGELALLARDWRDRE